MTSVGAYEAKTHLPRLLAELESTGRPITITKHGTAIAQLIPVRAHRLTPAEVIAELRSARSGVRRGRLSVRKMIDEGRR